MNTRDPTQRTQDPLFERLADKLSLAIGTPAAFAVGAAVVVGWAVAGPFADFTNTWQLFINTFTTITTFLMVFLLGNASNRITDNQDRMLEGILEEERSLELEERMIEKVLERIDVRYLQRIIKHLDQQDERLDAVGERVLSELRAQHGGAAPPA